MKMKNILILVLVGFAVSSCATVEKVKHAMIKPETAGFVPSLPDVPMPENFIINKEKSSFFDSAEGRIAEITAEGFAKEEEVASFYEASMPEFGWQNIGGMAYKKEGELIVIKAEKIGSITNLKYQLRPSL